MSLGSAGAVECNSYPPVELTGRYTGNEILRTNTSSMLILTEQSTQIRRDDFTPKIASTIRLEAL